MAWKSRGWGRQGVDYQVAHEPDRCAVEMTVVRDCDRFKEREKIHAIGVEPQNATLAITVAREAAKACGIQDVDFGALAAE
ncbi:MAG: hypothetical protein JSU86_16775 [Phycisphaerales bacterium]|nr:MAG: hypothetical protein JSU86_16775 [Phycisphaerales bacterium]